MDLGRSEIVDHGDPLYRMGNEGFQKKRGIVYGAMTGNYVFNMFDKQWALRRRAPWRIF